MTVQARFAAAGGRATLTHDDLDALADLLIAVDGVATVRLDTTGTAVYRVDVDLDTDDPACAAMRPLGAAERALGLGSSVLSVRVETQQDVPTARALGPTNTSP